MKNFKDLFVWQKSVELSVMVYELTKDFPVEEKYGLVSQMRRCAVSISSNIAEGHMRGTAKDFRHFIAIARGSCAELETQIIIANRLSYLVTTDYGKLSMFIEEISKMLSSLYAKLKSQS